MKVKRLFGLAAVAALFSTQNVAAQYYYPVAVSGFTSDVIANGVGNATASTTASVDAVDYAYVSKDFMATATSPAMTYGLPVTGQFMGVVTTTPGMTYQLASYSASNALKLNATSDSGTLTFATPTAAFNLYFLATGGSGSGTVSAVVNFSDGTNQTFTGLTVGDWYDQANFAIQGIGRIKITTNALEDGGGINPRIYQIPLVITAANQSKTVQSIAFTKTAGTGFVNIFGVSADKYTTCLAPSAVTASAVTASSATVSWTAPATLPTNYDIYYTSSTVAPSTTTAPTISNIASSSLSANFTSGINSMTKYHVWIRSKCGSNTGEWAYGTTFTTPCTTFPASYTENFDTTAVGSTTNTNAPMCWSYLETSGFAGYGYVTNSNSNSPTNSYYLYNSSGNSGNQMLVSPQTTALSDGTKRVRFFAKGSSANYTVQVGTLTNPADPTTFVSFNTTTLTTTQTQYTVNIPSGGGSYLAFRHNLGGTFRGIYLDDITVEAIPSCLEATSLTTSAVTANSATFSWTAPATAPGNGYEYTYTTTNTAPTGSGTTTSGTSVVVSLPAPSTTYYLWVRSKCTTTDLSAWTSIAVSTKAVNDECSAPVLITPGASFTTNPIVGTTVGATSTTDATATHTCQTTGYNDTWYSVVVPASGSIKIETQSVSGSAVTDTVLGVYTGACGTLTQVGCDDDSSTDGNFSLVTLTGQTPGATLLIGVWNYSASTSGQFRISAYDASLSTSEAAAAKKEVKVYPNPFTDIINISEFKDIKTVKVTDVAGRTLKTIENPTKEINLSSLNSGLYLITMYFKDGSQNTVKTIKK
ncbi:T9SS type A sorting domain-containing protein [Chryseobacterium formosus]|uniref:T9SS type A sorting domain-containing protein n=1 Tax=Chryseobacterium formosus TaxID=1537363 RepID=A0ABT3XSH8_9FLAO|nr:fibronectin type III domain-containing protein [Chryseobacterium formosus]MCX8524112.1 T9SS type A sorting domain-containing protein [Chryseobacterium formosus]